MDRCGVVRCAYVIAFRGGVHGSRLTNHDRIAITKAERKSAMQQSHEARTA